MNRAVKTAVGIVVVLLLLVGTGFGWRAYVNSRKLDELQAKAAEMVSQPRPAANGANPGDRGRFEGFRELRKEVEKLPEPYQQEFRQSMGNMFRSRVEKRLDEYLALTRFERKKHLDQEIAEGEQRRKQRDAERARGSATGGGNGSGAPGGGDRGRGWPGGRGSLSARLDSTSPAFRAKWSEYRRDMEIRRKELGLPAESWRGPPR